MREHPVAIGPFRIVSPAQDAGGQTYCFLASGSEPRPDPVLGADGVPRLNYAGLDAPGLGIELNIVTIGEYALERYGDYLRGGQADAADAFLTQARWLIAHHEEGPAGAAIWPFTYAYADVPAPWISAMSQGLAASVLSRAALTFGEPRAMDLARRAIRVFDVPVERGGVLRKWRGEKFFEEYPHPRWRSRALNGLLVALLGLHDLARLDANGQAAGLLEEGMRAVERSLGDWDLFGRWSLSYPVPRYPATADYHRFHVELLHILGGLTGRPALVSRADHWARESGRGVAAAVWLYEKYRRGMHRARRTLRARAG